MTLVVILVVLGAGYLLGCSSQRREDAKNIARNLLDKPGDRKRG